MAAEWLRADQVAALVAGHHEVLTTFTDLTGGTNTLREGCCAKCGARWPCSAAQWAAQDGRWRALVGELLAALGAIDGYTDDSDVDYAIEAFVNGYDRCVDARPTTQRIYAALTQAQAALDGAPGAPA